MDLPSQIYIDGGDPEETRQANELLKKAGYHGLDGQTTNPTLIAKNFSSKNGGKKVSMNDAVAEYKRVVSDISTIIPEGKISIQVLGDPNSLTTEEMLSQARNRVTWIKNGVIKFPCTTNGLAAVETFCQEGPVNITLNFSQEQAAAVYAATKTHNYDVFISPFVGRLDDKGQNGMDVVVNELAMYKGQGDGHVKVLTASVRNMNHLLYALWLKSPVVTAPFKIIKEWVEGGCTVPGADYLYDLPGITEIPYKELTLDKDWRQYDLHHDLTDTGVSKFWEDWQSIVSS